METELVNRIVKEVMATQGRPAGAAARSSGDGSPSEGECRARVFLTADVLRKRVGGGKTVEIEWNEVLTPNARDMVQQMHLEMRRRERTDEPRSEGSVGSPPCCGGGPPAQNRDQRVSESACACRIGWVVHRADGKVNCVRESLSREGLRIVEFAPCDCLLRNTTALCAAVRGGEVARGIVIAPYAAGVTALAGKEKGIRPVQGTRRASVEAAMRQFAANLLVIEHAFATFHEIVTMVRLFAGYADAVPRDKALLEALKRLEGGR